MPRYLKHLAIAGLLGASVAGCSDYLSGPSVSQDPNNPDPLVASPDNLLAGLQGGQYTGFASVLTFTICGYVQQCKGINGRFVETQLNEYNTNPTTFNPQWAQVYGNGGLRDIRLIQQKLESRVTPTGAADRDSLYEGIVKVWETLIMSEAADKWGDIPYSSAANAPINSPGTPPALDDQLAVYNRTLAVLDTAVTFIAAGVNAGSAGPGRVDFSFHGDAASWTALAYTLKARIRLHTLRHPSVCGPTITGCTTQLNQIVADASLGIQQGGTDFKLVTSGQTAPEQNGWFQFYASSGFDDDLRVGDLFANVNGTGVIQTRGPGGTPDPRAATLLFDPEDGGGFFPALVYAFGTADPAYHIPWVTADENSLILAEAYFRLGQGALADAQVTAVRTKYGLPALAGATLPQIMQEKYVALFSNPEVWNDWKRTGCPALASTSTQSLGPVGAAIPRRVYYSQEEQDNNPIIPNAAVQVGTGGPNLPGFRNDNDPPPDPVCS